jgi:hypothetical protein
VLIPGLQKFVAMLLNRSLDAAQLAAVEAVIGRKYYRIEPKLDFVAARLDMNMGWLSALVTEKEKPDRPLRRTVGIGSPARSSLPLLHPRQVTAAQSASRTERSHGAARIASYGIVRRESNMAGD